jgi:hypothetical protein
MTMPLVLLPPPLVFRFTAARSTATCVLSVFTLCVLISPMRSLSLAGHPPPLPPLVLLPLLLVLVSPPLVLPPPAYCLFSPFVYSSHLCAHCHLLDIRHLYRHPFCCHSFCCRRCSFSFHRRSFYRHLRNPVASIFAWTRGLGEFARDLEESCVEVIDVDGVMTKGLALGRL